MLYPIRKRSGNVLSRFTTLIHDNSIRLDIVPVRELLEVSSEPWKLLEINLDLYKSLV